MSVQLSKAKDFIYGVGNAVLWERALFAYLFEEGSLDAIYRALFAYKNPDNGFGHGLEHDIRTPESHPLALEFLLSMLRLTGLPVGNLLDGTPQWLESQQNEDGSLKNLASVLTYPHAPWWSEGGQNEPDSIVGNLFVLNLATPKLITTTRRWMENKHTPQSIRENEWLFMAYRAYDYFMADDDFPNVEAYREAVIDNIVSLAQSVPENQYYSVFFFAKSPDLRVSQAMPDGLLNQMLDYLESAQDEDGGWYDQHDLPQWRAYSTIHVLLTMRRYGRL